MKRRIENPFLVSGYVLPEYFCDREDETNRLVDAFRNSTQTFPLGSIPIDSYFDFAVRHMKPSGITLSRQIFESIYSMFDCVTWYVQEILNRLYGFWSAEDADVAKATEGIVSENVYNFGNIVESLPSSYVRLLRAIAKEGYVCAVNVGEFIAKHWLKATSSVNGSLAKLRDAGLIEKTARGYIVEDRFFGMWLAK